MQPDIRKKDPAAWLLRNRNIFLSYFVALCIILIAYIAIGIFPFGDLSILKSDLYHSYAPQFNDVRQKVLNGDSIIYSWSGGLGTNMFSAIITILTSPINLLMFLFPLKNTTELFAVLILLKIPFGAITFHIYAREKFGEDNLRTIIFSTMYALCAFMTAYHWNPMWLDTAIILPLVIMGIDRLFTRNNYALYCGALSYGIITSYGTAFQLCIFAVVYFAANLLFGDYAEKRSKIGGFVFYSILSGLICAVYLVPTIFGLSSSHYLQEAFPQFKFYYDPLKFIANMFWGAQPTAMVFSASVPNIYAGVFPVVLMPLFFLCKEIRRREKALYGILLLFLFFCFNINILTFIMHGMHFPSMMPHRYSYMFSFVVLVMSYRAFRRINDIRPRAIIISGVGLIALLCVIFIIHPQNIEFPKPGRLSLTGLIVNAVLVTAFIVLLLIMKRFSTAKIKNVISALLTVIIFFDVGSNTYRYFSHMGDGARERYVIEYHDDMKEVTQRLSEEPAFYRAEFKHERTLSDSKIYNYNGITTFSGLQASTQFLADKIGVTGSANLLSFANPSPVLTSFFSQKYLFNKNSKLQETFTLFDFKYNVGEIYVYENPHVLPLGFMVDEALQSWDIEESGSPYVLQNNLVNLSLNKEQDIFLEFDFEQNETEYITITETGSTNYFLYEIDEDVTSETVPTLTFKYIAPESKFTCFHIRTGGATEAFVRVNERNVLRQRYRRPATALDAGYVNKGDIIEITINMNRRSDDEEQELIRHGSIEIHAAQTDFDTYASDMAKLSENAYIVSYYDNMSVKGTINVDKEGLMFTSIPYDTNWRIMVDGKSIEPRIIVGALIAVKLYPGEHSVEFYYEQNNIYIGLVISLASLAAFVLLCYKGRKHGRTTNGA